MRTHIRISLGSLLLLVTAIGCAHAPSTERAGEPRAQISETERLPPRTCTTPRQCCIQAGGDWIGGHCV